MRNVSIFGRGVIDGQGGLWWSNCTACHYAPGNDSLCLMASRPKLLEFQFVDGLDVSGAHIDAPLTLKDSPFWTLTPSYSQNIHIRSLHITAPMDRIGNTDGANLDSCRNEVVENLAINNSDDGVCIKSGLDGYGMNLGIPTENVIIRNITCLKGGTPLSVVVPSGRRCLEACGILLLKTAVCVANVALTSSPALAGDELVCRSDQIVHQATSGTSHFETST